MNKYVIYTVITGGFDGVKQPCVIDERFDYVLFTNDVSENHIGVWQVRPIIYAADSLRLASRYPKAHPEICLPEYQASLYIDGTIQITSKWVYENCVELYQKGIEWVGIRHQWRSTIYDEMVSIIGERWVHDYDVLNWYKYLMQEGYIAQDFLFENNIIFRRHTENVKKVNDIWWWSIEKGYVKRDQFSLMYALWKVPEIKNGFFLPENENAWNNRGHFAYTNHNPHKRVLPWSIWETIRHRCFRAKYGDDTSYTILLDKVCSKKKPLAALQLWTVGALFTQGWKVILQMIKCRLPKKL